MIPLVSLSELQARLEWDLSPEEERVAAGALSDLSEDACRYTRQVWTTDTVPGIVKSLILRAAQRYLRNFDGLIQSRAGDETMIWAEVDREADTAEFTKGEIRRLEAMVYSPGLISAGTYAWGMQDKGHDVIYALAPHKPIPMYDPHDRGYIVKWGG